MEFQCPHCGISMSSEDENAGQVVACPACSQRFQIPALSQSAPPTHGKKSRHKLRGGWDEEDHANVNFLLSLGIGLAITVVFLLLLVPFKGQAWSDIFLQRGWVNYAEVFLFIWGMVILALKWRKSRHQRNAMLLDAVPTSLGAEINADTVPDFVDHIYKLPMHLRDSLMVNRIRKGLELFEKRNDNGEVTVILNAQSDIDANRISGSYTLLKVFLWAIPILGFIGTVQGLSQAVSSLSAGGTDPEALKASINNLTSGLGVAFDTTLLGLVLSMIMSFPMAAMQKEEEETLTLIDAFCAEKLLPRLNDSKNTSADNILSQAESIPAFAASLMQAHEVFLVNLNNATALLSQAGETLQKRLDSHQTHVEGAFIQAINRLTTETRETLTKPTVEMSVYLQTLGKGISSLDETLRKLGGETIVVKKKGLFSR
jgi:biopolymer transport protein ExbB/TolQ